MQNIPKIRGKMWILYINDKAQNWQDLCEQGTKMVEISDKIVWKYEYPDEIIKHYKD